MIYNEVVHLNADNKVLIEVLDGRTVRLTVDAKPLDVVKEGKKITSINIDNKPYLSLKEYNKIFVTINERIHTYEISEIDQIANNCFQAHTMVRTKSSFFVTPMLGNDRGYFSWGKYFVNTFLSEDSIIVLFRFFNVDDFKQFEHGMTKHPMFKELIDSNHQHVAVKFKVPFESRTNLSLFKDGKYSQMSDKYKEQILAFHKIDKDALIGKILFKSDSRREQLEMDLGVTIPPDVELYDKPGEEEYFKTKEDGIHTHATA